MLYSMKRVTAMLVLGSLTLAGLWAQQKQAEFKDRAEYDLFEQIRKEQNGNTLLGLLDQWKQKYPDSQFKDVRMSLYITAYQKLGDGKKMMQASKDLVAEFPKNFTGLYFMNLLTISLADNSPDALDTGEKAARGFLATFDEVYDKSKKPANVSDDAWIADRKNNEAIAYKTLGWVANERKKYDEAEANYIKVLERTPGDAQVSSLLGTAILRQKKPEKQAAGLYSFCRAAVYEGQGALAAPNRQSLLEYVQKQYVNYHGDRTGLDEILAMAKTSPLPPADFKIESKDEINLKKEEEFKKTNPQLALWISIKKSLAGEGGAAYFQEVKGSEVPGGNDVAGTKVDKFKATIVSVKPARPKTTNPIKEIVVGISSPEMSEATLRFETPVSVKAEPGMAIEFSGVPVEFAPDPFNLTFDVELEKIVGLEKVAAPKPAAPKPAAPKPAPKK